MPIQLNRYFSVMVIGGENKFVADIIERDLGFKTRLVAEPEYLDDAVRGAADCGAIVVARDHVDAAVKARDERGLRMPVFLLSRRKEETFLAKYLKSLHGVADRMDYAVQEFAKRGLSTKFDVWTTGRTSARLKAEAAARGFTVVENIERTIPITQ